MEDYPRNLTEFETRFASKQACREYLFAEQRQIGQWIAAQGAP